MPRPHEDDFAVPWCQAIINDPSTTAILLPPERSQYAKANIPKDDLDETLYSSTLLHPDALRTTRSFTRPSSHASASPTPELITLYSFGGALNGFRNTLHGGIVATVLDSLLSAASTLADPEHRGHVTASLTVDYKAPVVTPCVVRGRAWRVKCEGRKAWMEGCLEDGEGRVLARARGVWFRGRGDQRVNILVLDAKI